MAFDLSPGIAALLGATIGALPGVLAPLINARLERRKARLTLAVQLAQGDFERMYADLVKKGGAMPPMPLYVWFHQQVLEELDEGTYGPETIRRLESEMDQLMNAYPERR